MQVIDLLLKLQTLPPNMEVMIDHTREESTMFKFVELNYCDKVTTDMTGEIVVLSPHEYVEEED